jgi:diguanylate cyclase (GGDEF)-like protein
MQRCLRKTDLLGRYGGEEFCVLLSHTPLEGALTVAARIRRALASLDISEGDHKIRVTGSLGVATLNPERDTLETLIQRADFKMYTSKQMGRNRVSS